METLSGGLIAQYMVRQQSSNTIQTQNRIRQTLFRNISPAILNGDEIALYALRQRLLDQYAATTAASKLQRIARFLRWYANRRGSSEQLRENIEILNAPKIHAVRPRIHSAAEIAQHLRETARQTNGFRHLMMWQLLLHSGLRRNEAAFLSWSEIDLAASAIRLRFTQRRRLKTRAAARSVPMNHTTRAIFETLRDAAGGSPEPDSQVFSWINRGSFRPEPTSVGITPHDARRAFISALVSGAEIDETQVMDSSDAASWRNALRFVPALTLTDVALLVGHSGFAAMPHYVGRSAGVPGLIVDDFRNTAARVA